MTPKTIHALEYDKIAEQQVAIARSKALIEPHEPVSLRHFEARRLG